MKAKTPQSLHDREIAEIRKIMADAARDSAIWQKKSEAEWAHIRKMQEKGEAEWAHIRKMQEKGEAEWAHIREMQEKGEAEWAHIREMQGKGEEQMAQIREAQGDIGNAEGEILEDECVAALLKAKKIGNIRLKTIHPDMLSLLHGCQFDIVAEAVGKKTVVMEVKRSLTLSAVRKFAKRLPLFAEAFPLMALGQTVVGVIIYSRRRKQKNGKGKDPVQEALDLGLMVVRATGKNELQQITSAAEADRSPNGNGTDNGNARRRNGR